MSELYVRDDLFAQRGAVRARLTTEDIKEAFRDVRAAAPYFILRVAKGFILKFYYEKDVNDIMSYPIYDQLQDKNITPALTNDSRFHREIKVYDIPDSIYDESNRNIMNELERQNDIKVSKLTAYRPEYSSRNFFKVILANRADKELLIRRGIGRTPLSSFGHFERHKKNRRTTTKRSMMAASSPAVRKGILPIPNLIIDK